MTVTAILWSATMKGTLLLLVAAAFCFAWRRASAAQRHLVWVAAMIAVLALPLLSLALPSWALASFSGEAAGVMSRAVTYRGRLAGASLIWAVGAAVVVVRLAGALAWIPRAARQATPLSGDPWATLLADLTARLDLRRPIRLLAASGPVSPMAWGLWRPAILLPAAAGEWPEALRRSILLHELAHLKRHDWALQILTRLACAMHWFNPLVWWAARRSRQESERACDDQVLSAGAAAPDYAAHLLAVARSLRGVGQPSWAAVGMGQGSDLESRVTAILDPGRNHRVRSRGAVLLAAIFATVLVAPIAAMQDPGVKPPKLIHKVNPPYTDAAKEARIEGVVELSVEVRPDGRAHGVRVLKGLDPGLDENAVKAIEQWKFEPAIKDGEPVAVRATIAINFRLK
jgi:TonB family protein